MANCVLLASRSSPLAGTFRKDERNERSLAARSKAERRLSHASVRRANEEGGEKKQTNKLNLKQKQQNYGAGHACSPASLELLLQSYQHKGYLPP